MRTRFTNIFWQRSGEPRERKRKRDGEGREGERQRQKRYAWLDKFDRCRAFDGYWAERYIQLPGLTRAWRRNTITNRLSSTPFPEEPVRGVEPHRQMDRPNLLLLSWRIFFRRIVRCLEEIRREGREPARGRLEITTINYYYLRARAFIRNLNKHYSLVFFL